ncbi:hypothetical protein SDC9_129025 [bioreactor metagenome]|uniref:Uncharacterized protein n=1 Tax=bioreactor metagenome TaxID=1076179 RepID=A0A645CYH5_9ZZZZ
MLNLYPLNEISPRPLFEFPPVRPNGIDQCHACLQVAVQLRPVCDDTGCLDEFFFQADFHGELSAGPHLVSCSYDQGLRMAAHCQSELFRRSIRQLHAFQLGLQVVHRLVDVGIPAHAIRRNPHAAQVFIPRPIAEPAPHLHEGVVHHGIPQEVADRESFQRKSS